MAKSKVGRPTLYNTEIIAIICDKLAKGDGLTRICQEPEMPGISTVMAWLGLHKEFQEAYARAREAQGELMDQLILEAASAPPERLDQTGGVDTGEVQHRRLKIDALKWRAAHLRPKVYGVQRQEVEHSGKVTIEQILAEASGPSRDHA